ncbi:Aca2/YdiL-like domain-containing protein [Symbiopectobacterium sp. Eva_TO]
MESHYDELFRATSLTSTFFMSVDEAATYIANGTESETWRLWESGSQPIPSEVIDTLGCVP